MLLFDHCESLFVKGDPSYDTGKGSYPLPVGLD